MRPGIVSVFLGYAAILLPIQAAPAPFPRSVASPKTAAARKDRQKLQGTWYTVMISYSGGTAYRADKTDTITYDGDRYVQRENGRLTQAGTFAIVDATASPKRIEYVCTEGAQKGLLFRSIYVLDGDEHRVCSDDANDRRPTRFAGTAGFLRVTKRRGD
jgi:uncharacterized protein (TIGR03067 family)